MLWPARRTCAEVFRTVAPSVPRIFSVVIDPFSAVNRTQMRMGSGVVIDDHANVITNAHVVYAAGTIIIFAVPIDAAREIISQLLEHGRVIRAWHGINGKLVPLASRG